MGDFFIAVGGTGQMVAIAYQKIIQLMPWCRSAEIYYMDKDPLVQLTAEVPLIKDIDPLPSGISEQTSFYDYFHDPHKDDLTNDILDCLFSSEEQQTPIYSGMYGRPPVGASVVKSRFLSSKTSSGKADALDNLINTLNDGNPHSISICGSAVGGTGAGGVPSMAQYIHQKLQEGGHRVNVRLFIFYFLKHFTLTLPNGDTERPSILNDIISRNAESGMCYLKDEIAEGVDGCLLLGLDEAPQRLYEEVGDQTEQCHFLHLLSAIQLYKVISGEKFPANLCAYGISDHGVSINDLDLRLPNGESLGLGELLKSNESVITLLSLFKKLIDPLPGFSFVPAMPTNFNKFLCRLEKDAEKKRQDICKDIALQLERAINELKMLHTWFAGDDGFLSQAKHNYFLDFEASDISNTSNEFARLKKQPMPFIQKWCQKLGNIDMPAESYSENICTELRNNLYESINPKRFRGIFS